MLDIDTLFILGLKLLIYTMCFVEMSVVKRGSAHKKLDGCAVMVSPATGMIHHVEDGYFILTVGITDK